jgi:hypothetical protein
MAGNERHSTSQTRGVQKNESTKATKSIWSSVPTIVLAGVFYSDRKLKKGIGLDIMGKLLAERCYI